MAPHLLSLPAEIRNLIYEYALTEEDRLFQYREDCIFTGRLFPIKKEFKVKIEFSLLKDSRHDWIGWEKVLYEWYKSEIALLYSNQLQFVCRQLHYEMSGLSMKYNTILFNARCLARKLIKQCARFLQLVNPQQLNSLRVDIKSDDRYYSNGMLKHMKPLLYFCEKHPKSRINIYLERLDETPSRYFEAAHFLRNVLGRDLSSPFHSNGSNNINGCWSCWDTHANRWNESWSESNAFPSNLRLFPNMTKLDENCLRDQAQVSLHGLSVYIDSFVAWTKDWLGEWCLRKDRRCL